MRVVATAGHVDHGKSTLVRALTGMDPDRWEEEKRRGLTIDLGFAWTTLPSGAGVAFIDVPGHVRFLRNMLAGVGSVDACMFVVDALEGWKPQSEEHLRILELLGAAHGIVALTKVGHLAPDDIELAHLDVVDRLTGTFLDGAEIVPTDAPTGVGLGRLRLALDRLVGVTPVAADRGRPRLWIDRAFTTPGAGLVVTGTLTGGALETGMTLAVSTAKGERPVRLRGLESLGRRVDRLPPGTRAALNLTGVGASEVRRGDAVVVPGQWHRTRRVDAELRVLAGLDHDVERRGAYLGYFGSGEYPVRLRVLGRSGGRIGAGRAGAVRLELPVALPLLPGDAYVLRESGRRETVGGGAVLDVDPVLPAARANPDRSVDRVVAERGWIEAGVLERLTGCRRAPDLGRWVVAPEELAARREALWGAVHRAGPAGIDLASLDERDRAVLDELVLAGRAVTRAGRASPAGAGDPLADHPFVAALAAAPFSPPSAAEVAVPPEELHALVRRGLVVERDGVHFAPVAIETARRLVAELLAEHPGGVTVAQVRAALGTTRKWAIPLLNELDARGATRRRGDLRVPGPRLQPS